MEVSIQGPATVPTAAMAVDKATPASGQSLRDTITASIAYIESVKSKVEEYEFNAESDYEQTKEHFSKLKFNFIELETKHEFMEQLRTFDVDQFAFEAQVDSTSEKQKLKALKSSSEEMRERLEELSSAAQLSHEHFQVIQKQLESQLATLQELQQEEQTLLAQQKTQMDQTHGATTVVEAQSSSVNTDEVLRAAQTEFDQATLDVEQLEQQIAAAEAGIAQHEHTLAEKTSTHSRICLERKAEDERLVEDAHWHAQLIRLTAKLGGISVVQFTDGLVELMIMDSANKPHTLLVNCKNLTGQTEILAGSTFDGSVEALQQIRGVDGHNNSIPALVRAVQSHIRPA